eukprot:TRINITY_DN1283_c0_g1_i1.p1 TRINITY_DN1283_c0_g1~~TRINITY_DN1283_c0_g1_i1.p1  ORF type:complete len:338 (-),score=66.27 TRINITY_DN1283_c0_g1_i1:23-1036(-)
MFGATHSILKLKIQYIDGETEESLGHSIGAEAFHAMLRMRPAPTKHLEDMIPELRHRTEGLGIMSPPPPGISAEDITVAVIKEPDNSQRALTARWMRPANPSPNAVLYFHGGGYFAGSINSHQGVGGMIAKRSGTPVLLIDYALAPEHLLPAATDDAILGYRYLLENGFKSEQIIFAGDSAGGGLALMALQRIATISDLPFPRAAVLLSPFADITGSSQSTFDNADNDFMLKRRFFDDISKLITGENSKDAWADPKFSPVNGDFSTEGFSDLFIVVGGWEVLLDDSLRVAKKAKAAGVNVDLQVYPHMQHVFPAFGDMFPESDKAMTQLSEYIKTAF